MKAILLNGFGGTEMMVFGDVDIPVPSDRQILIKVVASSVNRPDVLQRQGNYAPPTGDSEILGLEVAGTVVALGEKVTQWEIGNRVMALIGGGGYAEYAVAYADHAMSIPENMSFNQAAGVCEAYITAYLNIFMLAGLGRTLLPWQSNRPSVKQSILLHGGGGGVNTAAIQLCKQLTPDAEVMVTASSAKVARVKQLGADYVIDYQSESFADKVKQYTAQYGGRGANVILDHIGGAYLAANMQCLAVAGTLVLIGIMGGATAQLNLALTMVKRQRIIGSVLRSRPRNEKAAIIAEFTKTVLPLMAEGKVLPLISEQFALENAANAHRAMEARSHFGKIVLVV